MEIVGTSEWKEVLAQVKRHVENQDENLVKLATATNTSIEVLKLAAGKADGIRLIYNLLLKMGKKDGRSQTSVLG